MEPRDYQQLVLCGFMRNREAFARIAPELSDDLFTEPDLQAVYVDMVKSGIQFSVPELEGTGGLALVRDIYECYSRYGLSKTFTFEEVRKFALRVEKLGRLHHLHTLFRTASEALSPEKKSKDLLRLDDEQFVSRLVSSLVDRQYNDRDVKGFKSFDYYLRRYQERLKKLLRGGEIEDRLATGFHDFDNVTGGGLPIPGLTVVAGNPGFGKTQWALQVGINVALRLRDQEETGVVAINSLEMAGTDLASRAILSRAGIDSIRLRTGEYNQDKRSLVAIVEQFKALRNLPLFVDDSDFLTSSMINNRVTGLQVRYKNVVLCVTDFAEIVSDQSDSPEQNVSKVAVNSKALSKRLLCSSMLLSHVNREVELTGTRVPTMRHLRYSAMLEQLADTILLIYNPNLYLESGISITPHPKMKPEPGVAYIIVAKNRGGRTGFLRMRWESEYTRWSDARL